MSISDYDREFLKSLHIDPDSLRTMRTEQESPADRTCRERQQAYAAKFMGWNGRALTPETSINELQRRPVGLGPKRLARLRELGIPTLRDAVNKLTEEQRWNLSDRTLGQILFD
jgi:hypothetical protein